MVGQIDDQSVVADAELFQRVEDAADGVVDERDLAVVLGAVVEDAVAPAPVALHQPGHVSGLTLVLAGASDGPRHVFLAIHVAVRRRRIVSVMGIDEGTEGEERLVAPDAAADEVDRVGGGPVGVVQPERDLVVRLAVVLRVVLLDPLPLLAAAAVLADVKLLEAVIRSGIGVHRGQGAAVRVVRNEMELPCPAGPVAVLGEDLGERRLGARQGHAVGPHAVHARVPPGEDGRPRRHTDRVLRPALGEACAAGGQLVEVGRPDHGVPREAEGVPAVLVRHEQQHVGPGLPAGFRSGRSRRPAGGRLQECSPCESRHGLLRIHRPVSARKPRRLEGCRGSSRMRKPKGAPRPTRNPNPEI